MWRVTPPQWKGCGAAGAIDPRIRGAAPEMGLIKGVGQGKGGAFMEGSEVCGVCPPPPPPPPPNERGVVQQVP